MVERHAAKAVEEKLAVLNSGSNLDPEETMETALTLLFAMIFSTSCSEGIYTN